MWRKFWLKEKNQCSSLYQSQILKLTKRKNHKKKIISVLKEAKQAFGVIAAKSVDLHEGFSYPITSLPLSIVSTDSSLYQSDKASFRNYIMKSSDSVSSSLPQIAKWTIDGMAAMRFLKPKSLNTRYMEWFIDFRFIEISHQLQMSMHS